MRLVLSGYYGFGNTGDEAVLAAMLQGLATHLPEAKPCVLSADPAETRKIYGVDAVQRWSLGEVWKALGQSDLVVQGGGGLIQDATSRLSPLYYLGVLRLARLRGRPTFVFAQGLGPLRSRILRRLTRTELERAAAITVRDEQSVRELEALGVRSPSPVLVADPALLLEPDLCGAEKALAGAGVDPKAPRLVLVVREWPGAEGVLIACRELAIHAACQLGLLTVVLPFQQPGDLAVSSRVAEGVPGAKVLMGNYPPTVVAGCICGADLVVAMRLHALIFAAAGAVPAIGLAYDPKVENFARRAAQTVLQLSDCSPETLISAATDVLRRHQHQGVILQSIRDRLRSDARRTFEILAEVCGLR